ncbi:MAG: DUF835 domain-containing protein, partial [Candidatus Thermoplasmatota archaeon]|nr:DUF835 domain-containing protein [Candidatus Thermoplasmatota archaeon]
LFFIGIFRYKMFLIEPSKEVFSDKEASFDLSMGHIFTVYEETPLYSPEIFADLVRHDIHGLAFLPNELDDLREQLKLPNTPMLRVGDKSSPNILSYNDDDDLDYIKYLARRFMDKSSNSVIIFGGLGKMLSEKADEGKKFLIELQSFVSTKKSRIILSLPPGITLREDIKDMLTGFVEL